jgi:hypothetical protein
LFLASAASARVTAVSASARREASFCFRNDSGGNFLVVVGYEYGLLASLIFSMRIDDDDDVGGGGGVVL